MRLHCPLPQFYSFLGCSPWLLLLRFRLTSFLSSPAPRNGQTLEITSEEGKYKESLRTSVAKKKVRKTFHLGAMYFSTLLPCLLLPFVNRLNGHAFQKKKMKKVGRKPRLKKGKGSQRQQVSVAQILRAHDDDKGRYWFPFSSSRGGAICGRGH